MDTETFDRKVTEFWKLNESIDALDGTVLVKALFYAPNLRYVLSKSSPMLWQAGALIKTTFPEATIETTADLHCRKTCLAVNGSGVVSPPGDSGSRDLINTAQLENKSILPSVIPAMELTPSKYDAPNAVPSLVTIDSSQSGSYRCCTCGLLDCQNSDHDWSNKWTCGKCHSSLCQNDAHWDYW